MASQCRIRSPRSRRPNVESQTELKSNPKEHPERTTLSANSLWRRGVAATRTAAAPFNCIAPVQPSSIRAYCRQDDKIACVRGAVPQNTMLLSPRLQTRLPPPCYDNEPLKPIIEDGVMLSALPATANRWAEIAEAKFHLSRPKDP